MNSGKAIAAYWEATFRGKLSDSELVIFETLLASTAVEDARLAIDDLAAAGGYPPTPQRIAELAEPHRKERSRRRLALEALPDPHQPMPFETWVQTVATEEEKAAIRHSLPSLAAKFGLNPTTLEPA